MREASTLSIGREALLSLGSKFVMALLGFAGVVLFARILGPAGLGDYRAVIAAGMLLTQFTAGTGTAIKKRVSEIDVQPEEYFGTGLLVHAFFSALVLVLFVLAKPLLSSYFGSDVFLFSVVGVVFSLGLFTIANRLYSGLGYPAASSWLDAIRSVLTLGLQVTLLALGYEVFGVILGFILGTLLSSLISMLVAKIVPIRPTHRTMGHVYSFARWSVSNSLLTHGYSHADVLLVKAFAGSGPAGFYTTAYQLTMPGAMFGGSIRDALSVKSSGRSSKDQSVRMDAANAISYAGLISIPVFFGTLAIPKELVVTVFGPEFKPAWTALVALTLWGILDVYRQPFEAIAEGTDRPALIFRINLAVLVFYLPLAVGLGLEYGMLGVIGATIAGDALRTLAYQMWAHKHLGGILLPRPIFEQFGAAAVMYIVVAQGATRVVSITNWAWLLVVVGVGAAVYFATLTVVSTHFRMTLRSAIADTVERDVGQ